MHLKDRMRAFPKSARLRQSQEFRSTLNRGMKTVCPHMVLFASPRKDDSGTRLGLVVSKKVGESVTRNRVKRQLREAYRHLRTDIDQEAALKNLDLVVVARGTAADASSDEMAGALRHCLKRLCRQLEAPAASPPESQGTHARPR